MLVVWALTYPFESVVEKRPFVNEIVSLPHSNTFAAGSPHLIKLALEFPFVAIDALYCFLT